MARTNMSSVVAFAERDGIEMLVLDDDTPCLSERGIAEMCGVDKSTIANQAELWAKGKTDSKFAQLLKLKGYTASTLFTKIQHKGNTVHAYPEPVCVTLLQYYAFTVQKQKAMHSMDTLATRSFRGFIYAETGYAAGGALPRPIKNLLERMSLNTVPHGYFAIFKELQEFMLALAKNGLDLDDRTIPDISVGKAWGSEWEIKGHDEVYGARIKHEHLYPESYRQSGAGPLGAWIYPVAALPAFRLWLQDDYIENKLIPYLQTKVKAGALIETDVPQIVAAVRPPALPAKGAKVLPAPKAAKIAKPKKGKKDNEDE